MDEEVEIRLGDLRTEAFATRSGPSTSTGDAAVRITHQPTGIVVEEGGNSSQLQNREVALQRLRAFLAEGQG